VEGERQRLGEDHPLFRTQYALLPITYGGGFLSRQQIALVLGEHARQSHPSASEGRKTYVAGVDLAGEHEPEMTGRDTTIRDRDRDNDGVKGRDSTVITIAEVDATDPSTSLRAGPSFCHSERSEESHSLSSPVTSLRAGPSQPVLRIVEQYQWTGTPHSQLYAQMTDILKSVWNCRRIVVDATGIGQPVASFLRDALGSKVIPLVITSRSKSDLGFELLSFVNSGRLKLYKQDGSREYQQTLFELERARAQYRPNQTMNFYVAPQEGHDDFLMSLALVVQAGKGLSPREAKGWLREN
jgi:hypothetical protein